MANMTDEDAARMLESLGMGAGGPVGVPFVVVVVVLVADF